MKKILVPLDFSPCSDNALKNAIVIASRFKAELLLLHSYLVPVAMVEHAPGYLTQEIEHSQKAAKGLMKELKERIPELAKVKYAERIEAGPLLDNVRSVQREVDLAMVVMGTHGATGLQRALLGSNAYNVMKNVKCPVIALPENANIQNMKHIGLAGDYKNVPTPACLKPVIELTKAFFADLKVVHIDQEKALEHHQLEMAKSLEKYLKHVKHSFHFKTDYDTEDGLVEFAKEHHIELLAMISKKHTFLDWLIHGSETRKMMLDIPMPLMVLHE